MQPLEVRLYIAGATTAEIADALGMSKSGVRKRILSHGVALRRQGRPTRGEIAARSERVAEVWANEFAQPAVAPPDPKLGASEELRERANTPHIFRN